MMNKLLQHIIAVQNASDKHLPGLPKAQQGYNLPQVKGKVKPVFMQRLAEEKAKLKKNPPKPLVRPLPLETLAARKKAYNTIRPSGYDDLNNYARYMFNNQRQEFEDPRSEEAFRLYLGLENDPKYFKKSKYAPTQNPTPGEIYYRGDPEMEQDIFDAYAEKLKPGESVNADESNVPSYFAEDTPGLFYESGNQWVANKPIDKNIIMGRPYNSRTHALGHFRVGRGKDKKGEYISYYDQYDFPQVMQDQMKGKPYKVYGRMYYPKKQKGGPVVSPYGQWAFPGKDTIVPTRTGKITMKGVPYPVYGKDETGYGQMMYPDGEYKFPGNMVYEKPIVKRTDDSTLENIAEVFDPTGITSWDDVYRSYKETGMSPETALEIFGALPLLGKVGKAGKMLGQIGKAIAVTNRQKTNVKALSNLLQATPYIGRGTDVLQTVQQVSTAPLFPFQKGGRAPIYTENPRDPRIRAYNDSLRLYNTEGAYLKQFRKSYTPAQKEAFYKAQAANYNLSTIGRKDRIDAIGSYVSVGRLSPDGDPDYVHFYKKPVQPVVYRKPQPPAPVVQQMAPQSNIAPAAAPIRQYTGSPVYSPGAGSGMPSALIGFRSQAGDTTFIQPEDYQRFAVPAYGKKYIESQTKQFSDGGQHGGLDRWFAEKWVDIKTGKECGRDEGESRKGYPACRPSRRVNDDTPKTASELSSSEREKFKRSKTSSERINYQHRRKEYGGEQTENDMANKPNNPALWSRAKSLAKQKFDVYPSAYANGWAAKWYKGKGGTWSKAMYGMEIMGDGGVPDNPGFRALPPAVQQKIMENMAAGGEKMPPEIARARFAAAGNLDQMADYGYGYGGYVPDMMAYGGAAQQAAIAIAMKKAGKKPKSMAQGGEPNGEMALGQMAAVQDKMNKLLQFVKPNDNLDPWIASKLAVMDHSADAISDYMMYGPEAEEQMDEMANGGYTVTRSNDRKGKTHKVTGPDGTVKYFGDSKLGQHPKDEDRKKAFYARHKKNLANNPYFRAFARETWAQGGYVGHDGKRHMSMTPTWSGNMGYQDGGQWHSEWNEDEYMTEYGDPMMEQFNQDVAASPAPMVAINAPASSSSAANPAPAPSKRSSNYSIVDFLNSQGLPSDYSTRKALAEQKGISGYRGTAEQNLKLLSMLKISAQSGVSPKPGVTKGAANNSASAATSSYDDMRSYNFSDGNILRNGYDASTANPFMFGQMPQRAVATPAAAAAKKVNAANAQDAEEAMTFAKYKAQDPYFFAEESDSKFVKTIDFPFTMLRDLGARTIYDQDPMAVLELLGMGAMHGISTARLAKVIDAFRKGSKTAKTVTNMSPTIQKSIEQAKRANLISNNARRAAQEAAQRAPRVRPIDPTKSATLSPTQRAVAAAKKSPGSASAPRTRALPNQMRRQEGGPVVGDEMEVTPEQLEQLRAQGYQFEII